MTIDILPFYKKGIENDFQSDYDLAILIDVYRATSSIICAAHKGAKEIYAVKTLEEMFAEKERNPSCILCGERNALKPDGFDFGNSPLELLNTDLKDKTVLISTSNGTRTLTAFSQKSRRFIAASFLNLSETVNFIKRYNYRKIILLCAGSWEKFSLEDYLCACLILSQFSGELQKKDDEKRLQISTGRFYEATPDELLQALQNTDHALRLKKIGKFDDVEFITSFISQFREVPEISFKKAD